MFALLKYFFSDFVILAAFGLVLCASPSLLAAERAHEIIAFGDSITQGYPEVGQPPQGLRVGGYEPDLETLADARSDHYNVYNYGWGGETTYDGWQRFDYVMSQHPLARYALILEGTNDIWHGISREDTVYFLSLMVDRARSYGIEPVVGTLTPDPRPQGVQKDIPLYNSMIAAMVANKNVVLADLYAEMVTDWVSVYTDDDLLHPNRAGYVKMANVWFATAFACSAEYLDQCFTPADCFGAGGYWLGDFCRAVPPPLTGPYLLLRPQTVQPE